MALPLIKQKNNIVGGHLNKRGDVEVTIAIYQK